MQNKRPSDQILLRHPRWSQLTMEQLQKDASLCGVDWEPVPLPGDYDAWITLIHQRLVSMERQSPELLSSFLYRVDLPEKVFLQNPFPSEAMAEAVLKREFLKVWFKSQYKS